MLDYSRLSRHILVTAGDDGSIHLWETTGRSPKVCLISLVIFDASCYSTYVCFPKPIYMGI